jgi:tripartite-type tricarboxylate transporter receptor subunit TctC
LNKEVGIALNDAEVRVRMAGVQVMPAYGTPTAFAALVQKDVARWTRVVQMSGIKAD